MCGDIIFFYPPRHSAIIYECTFFMKFDQWITNAYSASSSLLTYILKGVCMFWRGFATTICWLRKNKTMIKGVGSYCDWSKLVLHSRMQPTWSHASFKTNLHRNTMLVMKLPRNIFTYHFLKFLCIIEKIEISVRALWKNHIFMIL